jgi:hypothetical protein
MSKIRRAKSFSTRDNIALGYKIRRLVTGSGQHLPQFRGAATVRSSIEVTEKDGINFRIKAAAAI